VDYIRYVLPSEFCNVAVMTVVWSEGWGRTSWEERCFWATNWCCRDEESVVFCCPCRKLRGGSIWTPCQMKLRFLDGLDLLELSCFSPCVRVWNANKSRWENRELIAYVLEREFCDDVVWGPLFCVAIQGSGACLIYTAACTRRFKSILISDGLTSSLHGEVSK